MCVMFHINIFSDFIFMFVLFLISYMFYLLFQYLWIIYRFICYVLYLFIPKITCMICCVIYIHFLLLWAKNLDLHNHNTQSYYMTNYTCNLHHICIQINTCFITYTTLNPNNHLYVWFVMIIIFWLTRAMNLVLHNHNTQFPT